MNEDGALALQIAVIDQARRDYLAMGCGSTIPNESRGGLRRWLRSDLSALYRGPADPESIIANWDIQTQYQIWRKKHKCRQCKIKKCVHKNDEGSYTAKRKCLQEEANET